MRTESPAKVQLRLVLVSAGIFAFLGPAAWATASDPPLPAVSSKQASSDQLKIDLEKIRSMVAQSYKRKQDSRHSERRYVLLRAMELCQKLVDLAPDNADVLFRAATLNDSYAYQESFIGRRKSAVKYYQAALKAYDAVLEKAPKYPLARSNKADALASLAAEEKKLGHPVNAVEGYWSAIEEFRRAREEKTNEADDAYEQGDACRRLADVERDTHNTAQALDHYSLAIACFNDAFQLDSTYKYLRQYQALSLKGKAQVFEELQQPDKAIECMEQSSKFIEEAFVRYPDDCWTHFVLVSILSRKGDLFSSEGRKSEALICHNRALSEWRAAKSKWPSKIPLYGLRVFMLNGDIYFDKH